MNVANVIIACETRRETVYWLASLATGIIRVFPVHIHE
jgi:hypothetical protein